MNQGIISFVAIQVTAVNMWENIIHKAIEIFASMKISLILKYHGNSILVLCSFCLF